MKVSELIKELQKCDPNDLVVLSQDSEGNGYSPLAEIDNSSAYEADSSWGGEVGLRKLTKQLKEDGYGEEDLASKDAQPCVVLWPTN